MKWASDTPAFPRAATLAVVLLLAAGCASNPKADLAHAERDHGSRPMDQVRERQAEAQRRRAEQVELLRTSAATPPADADADPTQADALAQWIKNAEADGLLTNTPNEHPAGRAPRPRPILPQHAADPVPGFSPPESLPNETAAPTTALTAAAEQTPSEPEPTQQALPTVAASLKPNSISNTTPGPDLNAANRPLDLNDTPTSPSTTTDPLTQSPPLAALVKLHTARAAGDTAITDEQIANLERTLNPHEADFYNAWKSLQQSIAASANAGADASELKRAAEKFAHAARAWAPLRLPKAILCTRVEGFGMYQELRRAPALSTDTAAAPYTFLAGRRNKFIVYAEVDGFTSKPAGATAASTTQAGAAGGSGSYEVELAQDLTLYTASSSRDVIAWRKHDQRIKDLSKNQRRDFFIVQIVEIPETLSVGAYVLKVRLRDLNAAAGPGGEPQAEAVIPIDIVADDSAMR